MQAVLYGYTYLRMCQVHTPSVEQPQESPGSQSLVPKSTFSEGKLILILWEAQKHSQLSGPPEKIPIDERLKKRV